MNERTNVIKEELKTALNLAVGKKSAVIAYVLWFFLGLLGAHRFYLGKTFSAIVMLALTLIGYLTLAVGIGFIILAIVALWWIIDAVLILLAARKANGKIDRAIDSL